jgi:ParB family chromosome partitioning protein
MAHPVQIEVPTTAEPPRERAHAPVTVEAPAPVAPAQPVSLSPAVDGLAHISVAAIHANPHQPRTRFEPQALAQLAESIRTAGVMQPIIVRPHQSGAPQGNGSGVAATTSYELVAGERRWRAAQLAGLESVPAIVRKLDDQQVAEWALIENLQREDLNAMERAAAFQVLAQQFKLSHDKIAQRVGVDRSTITNTLRLLTLHADIQQLVRDNHLSLGQAKAIAALADQQQQLIVAKRVIQHGLSVRQVEAAIRSLAKAARGGDAPGTPETPGADSAGAGGKVSASRPAHLQDLEQQIGQQLSTRVHIRPGRKKGSGALTIEFYSLDQFDGLLSRLGVRPE